MLLSCMGDGRSLMTPLQGERIMLCFCPLIVKTCLFQHPFNKGKDTNLVHKTKW